MKYALSIFVMAVCVKLINFVDIDMLLAIVLICATLLTAFLFNVLECAHYSLQQHVKDLECQLEAQRKEIAERHRSQIWDKERK